MNNEIKENKYMLSVCILVAGIIIGSSIVIKDKNSGNTLSGKGIESADGKSHLAVSSTEASVLPQDGIVLPIVWGDLGAKLVSVGAIDDVQFRSLYSEREGFSQEFEKLLLGSNNDKIVITEDNSGFILNLFWALGLASENPVLTKGEMADVKYGGPERFASTGGWTIAKGDAMNHYNRHKFFDLTSEQQLLVEEVSKNIYRPCCNNSTHFPDCNHGMAMLGLLELMASQGASSDEMYRTALSVNSFWFPDNYITIATYMKEKGVDWKDVNPKEILGKEYSSASGFARIASTVNTSSGSRGGSGCSVDSGTPVQSLPAQRKQSGCSI